MRIVRAKAKNCKGFADFDQVFGDVNCITGRNAAGKSSVLDILCAAFVTDGDRDLLRVGAEEGEIAITIEDDDGSKIDVKRTLRPGKMLPARITPACGAVASFLKSIVDTVTLDPIRQVMSAKPHEKVRILLETMPLEIDAKLVREAADGLVPAAAVRGEKATLDTINSVRKVIYDARTEVNRDAKIKATHAGELAKSIEGWAPPSGMTWEKRWEDLTQRIETLIAADEQKRSADNAAYEKSKANALAERDQQYRAVDADIDAQIQELERARAQRKNSISDIYVSAMQAIETEHREMGEAIEAGSRAERVALHEERARAQQAMEQQARVEETCKIAEAAQVEAGKLRAESERMTAAIQALDGLKQKLLESLPIAGLKVEGGVAFLDGVPLHELNTAAEAKFWIRVAVLRAVERKLKVVVIDDAEHFDDRNWPQLINACKQSGLQFFLSRVEPHDFKIEVI